MPHRLKTTWAMLNPSSSAPRSPTTRPPPPSSDNSDRSSSPPHLTSPPPSPPSFDSSDLEVNLEDDPDRESDSEEEDLAMAQQGPCPEEVAVLNSLETAQQEEEDRRLRAITRKETKDCILRRTLEISAAEAEHAARRKDQRVVMEVERRRRVAARKEREEAATEKERKGHKN
ncbi:28 kDa heat- and acid-stable phosphoprotein homolog [Setaria italica]|uniref:28 kDa heat- and acid-stable phosphoprotein homolog n=1 Tax=Setaria italica TaxID=4555 RepID=UPI000350E27E|nr:28 kDa heat- and acid-stable phosphoprotein homolog [Setaria italica]